MATKYDPNLMRKEYVYALFIIKFLLGLALIYWTIATVFTSDVGKDDDNAFLSTYKDVDLNFNQINESNKEFENKYNIKFDFNGYEILGLSKEDVFLGQRTIQERKTRKDMILVGDNKFSVYIQDKEGNPVDADNIEILVTKNTNHLEDVKLQFGKKNTQNFEINSIGYWNITGVVEVDDTKGYFYIKTNAKR
jgi:hypothetical protein